MTVGNVRITLRDIIPAALVLVAMASAFFVQQGRVSVIETRVDYLESDFRDRFDKIDAKLDNLTDLMMKTR